MGGDPRVVLIAGTGQNGATILCRMLGALPGVVAVGELGHLWDKGLLDGRPCGCGRPFAECPFWRAVGEEAFGGWANVDGRAVTRLRGTLLLRRSPLPHPFALPLILRPGLAPPAYRRALASYGDLLARLYRGIAAVAGARVVVDSMKVPAHVYAVALRPALDAAVLHLVRDPRGVASSNLKPVQRQGAGMRVRRPPLKAAARWLWINEAFHVLSRRVPTTVTRYETLVSEPERELRRIEAALGLPAETAFLADGVVRLPDDHLVAGNRVRFERGELLLRPDDAWKTALSPAQRRSVTALAAPLLRRYGYSAGG